VVSPSGLLVDNLDNPDAPGFEHAEPVVCGLLLLFFPPRVCSLLFTGSGFDRLMLRSQLELLLCRSECFLKSLDEDASDLPLIAYETFQVPFELSFVCLRRLTLTNEMVIEIGYGG